MLYLPFCIKFVQLQYYYRVNCLRIILFLSAIFITGPAIAQPSHLNKDSLNHERRIDSLKQLISHTPDDTQKVKRLVALSDLQFVPEETTPDFAQQALTISQKLGFKEGIAIAYKSLGSACETRKDYNTAIKYFQQALTAGESFNYEFEKVEFFSPLLNLYFYLGDYPNAMETISREMTFAEKMNDKRRIAHCNNILGYIYFKQENFTESEKYYGLYIKNAKELNDSLLLSHAMGEISDVYTEEKKYKESIDNLFTTIRICEQLLAVPHPSDSNFIRGWAPQYHSKTLYRLSKVYKMAGDLQKALQYSQQAIESTNQQSIIKYDIASYYITAGDIYKDLKEYKKAIDHLMYGLVISKEIRHRENTRDAAKYLSQTYALLHQYDSAFYYYQLFTGLRDSIVNNETKMKIAGIQGQYDVAKKDKEIVRQQQIRNILIGSFIFLLILLLLLYNRYRLKQKNKTQQEYNRQQNELFNTIVSTQDQERKRIAQDIHDSLGSVLSAARLKLSSLGENKDSLDADQVEKYQATLDLLDEASSELRNISHNIMPATLSKLGLVAALQNLIGKISSHPGMQISFTAHEFEGRIEETAEMSIYRIILELINNIVKHAAANKVTIQLIKYPAYINLVVEDNGRGFNYAKALEEKKGIGLGNILSRVEYLKGTIDIDSSPGKGTTVIIEIPYRS